MNYARPLAALSALIVFATSLVLAYPDRIARACPSIFNKGNWFFFWF